MSRSRYPLFGLISTTPRRRLQRPSPWIIGAGVTLALALVTAVALHAQTPPPPPNAAASAVPPTPAAAPTVGNVIVTTVDSVELSPSPTDIEAQLSPQLASKIGKGGATVRLVGSSRGTKASGGSESTIGQVVWNGVTADVNGHPRTVPLDKPLTSQFVARQTTLPPGTDVKAVGDPAAIITAAQKLFDVQAEATNKAAPEKKPPAPAQTAIGGGASENDVAANGFKAQPGVVQAAAPTLPTAYGTTTEGCTPRVDETQGVVILQSKQTKSEGGTVTDTSACSDTETRYPIQKSYASCQDHVDLDKMEAYAQYREYWVDDQGRTSYLGDCKNDTDAPFVITADKKSCTMQVDTAAMLAYQQAQLVYTNKNNLTVVAQPCQRTVDAGLPITQTAAGCTLRDDFTNHVAIQQTKMVYTDPNGSVVSVTDCADDTTQSYAMTDVRNVCADLVDQASGEAWPQRRWQINPPSGPQYVSQCEPVQDEGVALQDTVSGCDTIFFNYIDQGQSFGAHRFYYSFDGGTTKTYVTGCEQSTVAYPQQVEIQGYEYHDDQKYGLPKTDIYINTPVGRVDVSPAQVRDGAPQVAYILDHESTDPQVDQKYWEGCNAYMATVVTDYYKRPDATLASYVIGAGTPSGPVDECTRTTQTQTAYAYHTASGDISGDYSFGLQTSAGWTSAIRWPGGSQAAVGAQYLYCAEFFINHSNGGSYDAHFIAYNTQQTRVETSYPNNGGISYSAWQNVPGTITVLQDWHCTEVID